ncbi:Putative serine/threonine-protein kinase-like protein CCR3 [Apostasia shenzhenica]|uniref:Serine/threonine-protein kinase-like protein CCR3 n=1 Tax=Apostasia shenzhenica TaxID=1088818 RepID=A0A2I0BH32_9ASPA|nr:Putative serine/threonine-protein kinase-like protein CCR3 [Apostasia shenzhenica]
MRIQVAAAAAVFLAVLFSAAEGLGSAATIAIVAASGTVCGILAGDELRSIQCAPVARPALSVSPNFSFVSVSGGREFFCGLRYGGLSFFCWNAANSSSVSLPAKRVYKGSASMADLSVGEDQIFAFDQNKTGIRWWRGGSTFPLSVAGEFRSLTSGRGFSCAIGNNSRVLCWGRRRQEIQSAFANETMTNIVAGDSHVCGLSVSGFLICRGSNRSGQSNPPAGDPFQFSGIALGANHSCAIKQPNGTVICWGGEASGLGKSYFPANNTLFVSIVAGGELTCGLTAANFKVICWKASRTNPSLTVLPLPKILPGICVADESSCECGIFPDSESLCSGSGVICKSCGSPAASFRPSPPSIPPPPAPSSNSKTSKGWLAFAIVGSVGAFAGVCTILYCLWAGICRRKKVHNSVQPTFASAAGNGAAHQSSMIIASPFTSPPGSKSRIFRRQPSRVMRRQRSGPSSFGDRTEEFTFDDLAAATKNFSIEFKIGSGSFGTVYRGKLPNGLEVAIKRGESGVRAKKLQDKESAFESEVAFLSRLHHKHLVGFVGYCVEKEERLLVYEYMKNGALYGHLHADGGDDGKLNSWQMRIKVLLDAARGIEYLHSYAVPPIIHRDIKSSNILLDSNWVAKVSDFGLSLMSPEAESGEHLTVKAAGTVGYMDPEYYGLRHLTTKSDVYGFGVVILEVLTGRRAIFREEESGEPVSVVDYAAPVIASGNIGQVLDRRVAAPGPAEAEALELVAYTAVHCVSLEGKDRPAMTDIVINLESAVALCDASQHDSGSSASISLASMD